MSEIISRKEAKAQGLKRYFTNKPCKHLHVAERLASTGMCLECARNYSVVYYTQTPDKFRARSAANRKANPDKGRALTAAWCEANPDRVLARSAQRYEADKDKKVALNAAYYAANKDKCNAKSAAWAAENPDKVKASKAKYRAAKKAAPTK